MDGDKGESMRVNEFVIIGFFPVQAKGYFLALVFAVRGKGAGRKGFADACDIESFYETLNSLVIAVFFLHVCDKFFAFLGNLGEKVGGFFYAFSVSDAIFIPIFFGNDAFQLEGV
jgi:hypothetical protein